LPFYPINILFLLFIIKTANLVMVFDILSSLERQGRLNQCSISVSDKSGPRGRRMIFGRDITGLSRSHIEHAGGETGYEIFRTPVNAILQVELENKIVFRKKSRIERIYPRA
jgi:hypothetical protein